MKADKCAVCHRENHNGEEWCTPCITSFDRYMEQACPKCEGGEGTMCKRHAEEELESKGRA